ncbi:STAS domain-containing protein [Actinoplanes sp. CA-252034]|uniref:STAS domain-containing protein n=1 Tax=Actinoplanes sp. CA-252034 TaxID=3239906 RepID=UPI003D97A031
MSGAAMTARQQADGATVMDVRGSLDVTTVDALRATILDALHRDRPRLMILDLTLVTFMDSTGIGLLAGGHQSARDQGTRFVVRNPSEFVHRQLRLTGLAGMLGLCSTSGPPAWRI